VKQGLCKSLVMYNLLQFSCTVTEFIITKYRMLIGNLYNMSYPLGLMLLPLIAFYIEEWRMLQLILSIPTVILIVHIWYVRCGWNWKYKCLWFLMIEISIGSDFCFKQLGVVKSWLKGQERYISSSLVINCHIMMLQYLFCSYIVCLYHVISGTLK
jgi:hypothetical protein